MLQLHYYDRLYIPKLIKNPLNQNWLLQYHPRILMYHEKLSHIYHLEFNITNDYYNNLKKLILCLQIIYFLKLIIKFLF